MATPNPGKSHDLQSRFNPRPNVVYKRTSRGNFCPNDTENLGWGIFNRNSGEISSGIDISSKHRQFFSDVTGIWDSLKVA